MTLRISPAKLVARAEATGRVGVVGCAPNWPRVRLGDVARVTNGAAFKSHHFNVDGSGLPLIRIRDVGSAGPSTWYDGPWEKAHLVKPGDLLIGMDGDFRAARWSAGEGLLNQRVCRVDVDGAAYNPRFMEHVIQGYLDLIWEATSATTVKHLSSRSIQEIPVPMPSLQEQAQIVDILEGHLTHVDAANEYLRAVERRLRSLRRSALDEDFGRRGGQVALSDLVRRVEAGRSFGGAQAPAGEGEWGIIKVSAMTWGEFRPLENKAIPADRADPRYEIRPADLLLSRANTSDYVGASVLVGKKVPPRLLLSDKSLRIVPAPGVDARWLWRALQAPSARTQISSAATGTKDSMRNISQQSLLQVQVPKVDESEQRAAVARFDALDASIKNLDRGLVAAESRAVGLRRALLAAAFSGKLTGGFADHKLIEEAQ